MSWAHPFVFLLLPLPFLALRLLSPRLAATGALRVPPAIAAKVVPAAASVHRTRLQRLIPPMIWLCLILVLAGPGEMRTLQHQLASGRDIMLALDLSGSMEKEDFDLDGQRISRLDAVKQVGSRFVEGRAGDRLGLVVFGDRAYVATPLTHDTASVARTVNEAVIGVSGKSTAISDGLGLAMRRLRVSDAKTRVVVLFSDGVDTTGSVAPEDVAALADGMDIRIHTIALGPDDLESNPAARDAVDAETLRLIAQQSGGRMFRVRDMAQLQAVVAVIDALEPSPSKAPPVRVWHDYWTWPAAVAFVLSLIALALSPRDSS